MSLPAFAPPPRPVTPGLYLVATPIGNLRDITLRALDVLAAADVVLAEDTRVTGRLLQAYGLDRKLVRYDDNVGENVRPKVMAALAAGQVVAQVSDAGTPMVSDPGYRLAAEAAAAGFKVHPVPGPSSVLAALTLAGLPSDRFLFAGFTPHRSAGRRSMFEELRPVRATLIFFETGPRLRASLEDMLAVFGAREAAVARELTKLYEECVRGPLDQLAADPRLDGPKGEIVVLVGPGVEEAVSEADADGALAEALTRMGPADAASEVSKSLGLPRKALYRRALELKGVT
ncbi:MAG TPA: 16S rRNA (cytidine(1402)-2'-O)-methyltransferase [Caulobacteraceae bacterium]|nr:16S rRNA (cytidine(1402)-2'-O)-methyltransferase [Caulobacteraceae bacterium]